MRIAVATKLLTERGARREAGDKALIALEGFTGLTAMAEPAVLSSVKEDEKVKLRATVCDLCADSAGATV